jgi:DNA-binding PadR family transcriptional regulator
VDSQAAREEDDMNATSASLLGLLDASGGELTGGELVRVAQLRLGRFWSLTRSQVYRELVALEGEGLVRAGSPGVRDARPVRITAPGRKAYRSWLTEHLPSDTIRIPVLLAVAFGSALDPAALKQVLESSRQEHAARLEEYRELDQHLSELEGGEPWARATLSFGMHYEQAVLSWFDTLPAEVRPG